MQPELIAARYEVIEQVSDSNMAVVYRAFDRRTQTQVAIKKLKLTGSEPLDKQRLIHRFKQEAAILSQFKGSLHVVEYLDFIEDQASESYLIIMEYIDNSLRKMLKAAPLGRLPISLVVSIAYALSSTLQEAHDSGVIHCDIKPSNILMTNAGVAKLADFGVAYLPTGKLLRGISQEGFVFGTPQYWPPESATHTIKPNVQTDIWAFGVTVYELLTGEHPLSITPNTAEQELLNSLRRNPVRPLQELRQDIPVQLETLVHRLLSKNRRDRITSFAEVNRSLRRIYLDYTKLALADVRSSPHEPLTQYTQNTRGLLKEIVKQGSTNDRKEWVRFGLATLIGVVAIFISMREVQLQADANEQLQATIIFLSQSTQEPGATFAASLPENTVEPTATSLPPSHTPEPTARPTDVPTRTDTPSPSPSPSPSITPSLTLTISPTQTASATAIRAAQDASGLPCQTSVEESEPYALVYEQPSLAQPSIDRLWKEDILPVEQVLPGWIGVELQGKHAFVRDEQVKTYGDCDDLFLRSRPRTTLEATSTASLTPTPSLEPTPTRPRPPRPTPTQAPTDVPTVIYIPPPITQNPPADVPQPAEPTLPPPQPVATSTSIPPTDAPQPTNTPIPTAPPQQPTTAPEPTSPPNLPTDTPITPTRGAVFPLS